MFGVVKHIRVQTAQHYYSYITITINHSIQEIQKIKSNIQKKILKEKFLKKEMSFFGKGMLQYVLILKI